MQTRTHRDLAISEVGVGCYALSGVYGQKDVDEFRRMLRRAYELGINFFDTAAAYGEDAERILGETVQPFRDEAIIATKIGLRQGAEPDLSPETIRAACERSLSRLGIERIDLYQVHYDDPRTPVEVTVETLEALRREGKIRHYGLSHLPAPRIERYMQVGDPFSELMELSAVARGARETLLPLCREHGVAGIAFSTTGRGLLTGRFDARTTFPPGDLRHMDPLFQRERFASGLRVARQLARLADKYGKTPAQAAIAWVLAQPGITCALTGPSSVEHLEENAGASGWQFEPEDLAAFEQFLENEEAGLRVAQRRAVRELLSTPLSLEAGDAFVGLVYAVETAVTLGLAEEETVMPVFLELFALRESLDEAARQQMEIIQARLREVIPTGGEAGAQAERWSGA